MEMRKERKLRGKSICLLKDYPLGARITIKILNIGTCMSEQTVQILIRLLLKSSLIRIYTVCHSFYFFWRHYFIVKLNCFILRTTTVAGLGVPIFRVFTVHQRTENCRADKFSGPD